MKIEFHQNFIKDFKRRYSSHPKIKRKFFQRVALFEKDPSHPLLKDHALSGKKLGLRAFSVTGDIRVVYFVKNNTAFFLDIETHT